MAAVAAGTGGKHVLFAAHCSFYTISVVFYDVPVLPPTTLLVFDPFFTTKAGTGLGLATCCTTAVEHDGHIDIASEPARHPDDGQASRSGAKASASLSLTAAYVVFAHESVEYSGLRVGLHEHRQAQRPTGIECDSANGAPSPAGIVTMFEHSVRLTLNCITLPPVANHLETTSRGTQADRGSPEAAIAASSQCDTDLLARSR